MSPPKFVRSELVVQANLQHLHSAGDRDRIAVQDTGRSCPVIEIEVVVFDLGGPILSERDLDTGADQPSNISVGAGPNGGPGIVVDRGGVVHPPGAGLAVPQDIVGREAEAASDCRCPVRAAIAGDSTVPGAITPKTKLTLLTKWNNQIKKANGCFGNRSLGGCRNCFPG